MNRISALATPEPPKSSALAFAMPGIFPEHTRLLFDQEVRTALLVSLGQGEPTPLLSSSHLTPSAAQIFLCLLQAHPSYCSYQALFGALFPLVPGSHTNERVWEKQLALRPVRRALAALSPAIRALGLQVVSLRGLGYMLAPAAEKGIPIQANRHEIIYRKGMEPQHACRDH